jgi:hypothetical protein
MIDESLNRREFLRRAAATVLIIASCKSEESSDLQNPHQMIN